MYRWLLQLSPGTSCKYLLLFFSMLVQFAPIPFWNMVVHMNALLGKAECFCDCSIIFIFFLPSLNSSTFVFFIICVCECMFVRRGETHRHCTGWLFSWFIIINHCNDSFIQLVVTCVSGNICAAGSAITRSAFCFQEKRRGNIQGQKASAAGINLWEVVFDYSTSVDQQSSSGTWTSINL